MKNERRREEIPILLIGDRSRESLVQGEAGEGCRQDPWVQVWGWVGCWLAGGWAGLLVGVSAYIMHLCLV